MAHNSGPDLGSGRPGGLGRAGWVGTSGLPPEYSPPESDPVAWHARRRLWLVVALVTTVGYLVVGVLATARVYWEFHRKPTKNELARAAAEEVGNRWRTWPVDRIFPDTVPYTSEQGGIEHAKRIGIAPETACTAGIDPVAAATIIRHGCRALLRATYVDQLQGIVLTVGVAALADEQSADRAMRAVSPPDPTVGGAFLRALAIPGTITARFDDASRQYFSAGRDGPYVVLTVAGQTDGRPATAVRHKRVGAFLLAPEVAGNIGSALALQAEPDCARKQEWTC
jgi:hypothetical protein